MAESDLIMVCIGMYRTPVSEAGASFVLPGFAVGIFCVKGFEFFALLLQINFPFAVGGENENAAFGFDSLFFDKIFKECLFQS